MLVRRSAPHIERKLIMAKIAVLGYGVVGSGTVEVFYKNKESLEIGRAHV